MARPASSYPTFLSATRRSSRPMAVRPVGGAANNGPISLNAPGVPADNEDEIELPPEGSPKLMRAPQQAAARA